MLLKFLRKIFGRVQPPARQPQGSRDLTGVKRALLQMEGQTGKVALARFLGHILPDRAEQAEIDEHVRNAGYMLSTSMRTAENKLKATVPQNVSPKVFGAWREAYGYWNDQPQELMKIEEHIRELLRKARDADATQVDLKAAKPGAKR